MQFCLPILPMFWITRRVVKLIWTCCLAQWSVIWFWTSSERNYLRTAYFILLIIAACVVIYWILVTFEVSFEVPVNAIRWERRYFKFYLSQLVLWYIQFSIYVVCFLCPCFNLSAFHLLAGLSMGMGFLWESHGKRRMGWDRHKLLWDGNGTDKYVPWTTLGLSMGMSFLWESHGKRPMGWDGIGINCYGMGMGQMNPSHRQPCLLALLADVRTNDA